MFINSRESEINKDGTKKVSFKASEASSEAWVEEIMKKINEKNGSAGSVSKQEMTSEFDSTL